MSIKRYIAVLSKESIRLAPPTLCGILASTVPFPIILSKEPSLRDLIEIYATLRTINGTFFIILSSFLLWQDLYGRKREFFLSFPFSLRAISAMKITTAVLFSIMLASAQIFVLEAVSLNKSLEIPMHAIAFTSFAGLADALAIFVIGMIIVFKPGRWRITIIAILIMVGVRIATADSFCGVGIKTIIEPDLIVTEPVKLISWWLMIIVAVVFSWFTIKDMQQK